MKFNFLLLSLTLAASLSSAQDIPSIAARVDSHYNHLRTLTTDFTETYRGAGADRTESGILYLRKSGKMRWEYRSPREKLFISDGKNAWFFIPGEPQVRTMPVKSFDDLRSPLSLLLGKTQLQKELKDLAVADITPVHPGDIVLKGIPQNMADRLTDVLLEINNAGQITRLVLDGADGSVTEYNFDNQRENLDIPEQQFRFVPPPGVEVVRGDLAQ